LNIEPPCDRKLVNSFVFFFAYMYVEVDLLSLKAILIYQDLI
jgi:hypothetical protein